ncbi:CorA family metal ion transporter, putative [Penicillium digitatum PHI26]|uniref:CorA family metal ion transporter, putative n=2 Tax=Penicillium digitatum TaxID=36651 RepID=K9GJV9_PEND2|nr:CorA family metal ion transporter, putative [Penicillium digitatum Pd1]EKV05040.1 CorA family metal ion transporter, putative [Penicillium digitatum Pd1]EKV13486.1 CorA family metal ion transporter, putative [Penicillium digitatum PHI26]
MFHSGFATRVTFPILAAFPFSAVDHANVGPPVINSDNYIKWKTAILHAARLYPVIQNPYSRSVLATFNLYRDPKVEAVTMNPPMIPTPGTAASRLPRSSHYPPSADNTSYGPMSGGRAPGTGPVPVAEATPAITTRLESPADDAAGKPSKSSKRKKNRNRKRRNRHQSFIPPSGEESQDSPKETSDAGGVRDSMDADRPTSKDKSFFKLGRNLSNTSLESDALLDHRDEEDANDRTPLMRPDSGHTPGHNRYGTDNHPGYFSSRARQSSTQTVSSGCSPKDDRSPLYSPTAERDYDVNNPPSIPGSPKLGPEMNYDDAVVTGADWDFSMARSLENRKDSLNALNDTLIDIDGNQLHPHSAPSSSPGSPLLSPHQELRRRRTVAVPAQEDVCFPTETISELGDEGPRQMRDETGERRRRRHRRWPDLSALEEWSREEKGERNGDIRVKRISEPMLIEGRLRPQYTGWRREEDEAPYRFTYFNEEFPSTVHAQTISELVQPGGSFRDLFIPTPPELEDSSEGEDEEEESFVENTAFNNLAHPASKPTLQTDNQSQGQGHQASVNPHMTPQTVVPNGRSTSDLIAGIAPPIRGLSRLSAISEVRPDSHREPSPAPSNTPFSSTPNPKPKRYGPRPTFWLDVLSPTDAEMRTIAKAFGIHALTAEDIMMQEAREKVELFRSYYFVNYRTFEQDTNSEDYLEPVNMYVVVFREGVISFHFSQTPHPANVRRRIRQLMDYLILSSDWISYALIDDITDVFGPLIQAIEDEVDEIDEMIMQMHSSSKEVSSNDSVLPSFAPGEMLRRVGECRKKVMGLYRLLSNKADVVKGFAKRCNEQWEVAPKSEIGLYLGDIQDHIMTMTGNLTHYETILSRAHSNYLAQINILMNERQEHTADVLGKLTVLGTIVLPMNIICGMWGMNVKVPGQEIDSLTWFWCSMYSHFASRVLY